MMKWPWKKKKTLEEIHAYWLQPKDRRNEVSNFVGKEERSETLYVALKRVSKRTDTILEIGCNVGRNLNYLQSKGYKRLFGLDISQEALSQIPHYYPDLELEDVYHSSIEDAILTLPKFDIIFTMATLEHIHPDSEWIFSEIADKTIHFLITIEDELGKSWRHFPRNYKKVFEEYGMQQIFSTTTNLRGFNNNFVLRVFSKY